MVLQTRPWTIHGFQMASSDTQIEKANKSVAATADNATSSLRSGRPISAVHTSNVLHKMKLVAIFASGALLLCTLGYAGYSLFVSIRQEVVGPSYGYIFDDWPDGVHSDKYHWRGGVFFGFNADKIRWMAKPKGEGVDAYSKRFFVRVPMNAAVFDELIRRLQSSEEYAYRASKTFDYSRLFHIPDWFPRPEEAEFVCAARDESNWSVLIVRGKDDYTYLHLN